MAVSYKHALEILSSLSLPDLPTVTLPILDCIGRTNASTITSPLTTPPFANSAMDGFVLVASTTTSATPESPVEIPIKGCIAAGAPLTEPICTSTCHEITTGAPIPDGYDAVIRHEHVTRGSSEASSNIIITRPVHLNENIRPAGRDFRKGDIILEPGILVTPAHLMALSSVGISHISVLRELKIGIITTGPELAKPGDGLKYGQIFNSNGPYLSAVLKGLGHRVVETTWVEEDTLSALETRISAILKSHDKLDVLITTGGVSMGRYDCVREAIESVGFNTLFHGVAIRPGHPVLCGRRDETLFFGLPGNPIAAAVCLRSLVIPFFECRLQRKSKEKALKGRLISTVKGKKQVRCWVKAYMDVGLNATLEVRPVGENSSALARPLLHANCWVVVPEDQSEIQEGSIVDVWPCLPLALNGNWPF